MKDGVALPRRSNDRRFVFPSSLSPLLLRRFETVALRSFDITDAVSFDKPVGRQRNNLKKMKTSKSSVLLTRPAALLALFLTAWCLPSKVVGGEAVHHVGFEEAEGYTPGPLLEQGAQPPDITRWLSPENEAMGGAEVVTDSAASHLPAPQGSQMLQVQYGAGNPAVLQNFLSEAKAIKQDFKVTFLLAVDAEASNGTFTFAIQSSSGINSGAWFGIRRVKGETDSFGFFYKKTDPDGKIAWEKIGDGVFEPRQFYKVEMQVNHGNLTYGGRVTNADGQEVLKFSDLPLLDHDGHMGAGRGFNRIYIGADQIGTKPYFLVDDITIELLP